MASDERGAVRIVRVTGAAVLALGVALLVVMPMRPVRANLDGITSAMIGFELATTPEQVLGILGGPADAERPGVVQGMDRANRIDFLFMVAYPALSFGIAMLLVARGLAPAWLQWLVGALALVMFAGDFVENRQLLVLSQTTDPATMTSPLAVLRVATRLKWMALFVTMVLVGMHVWRDTSRWRFSAPVFVGAGLLGLAGAVWLPGIEHGGNVVGIAWLWTWVHSLRSHD